ncbi:MAG: DUF5683 domain-containing protein [Candidatus Zophobacter franzmannii]|nr:DUF5683 domain-containing protein [Candidatus Zophobacter franzmannii]
MKRYIIIIMLVLMSLFCYAEEKAPVPWKAASLSFIFPGGGQVYNQSYLKGGVVFLTEATFFGMSVYHHNEMKRFEGKRNISDEDYELYNPDYEFNYYRRNSYYWWLGLSVILSVADAYVDASLWDFEANKSKIHLNLGKDNIGLSLRF